ICSRRLLSPFTATPPPVSYPLSLHDALPISLFLCRGPMRWVSGARSANASALPTISCTLFSPMSVNPWSRATRIFSAGCVFEDRSEEHTSELQSRFDLVCRLLLEKKNETRHI